MSCEQPDVAAHRATGENCEGLPCCHAIYLWPAIAARDDLHVFRTGFFEESPDGGERNDAHWGNRRESATMPSSIRGSLVTPCRRARRTLTIIVTKVARMASSIMVSKETIPTIGAAIIGLPPVMRGYRAAVPAAKNIPTPIPKTPATMVIR